MKMNHARIAKLLKRAYHSWGARAIAIVLIVVLSLQTVMSSGVPQVLAQEIGQVLAMSRAGDGSQTNDDDGQDGSSAETLETDNGSGGSAQNGQSGEQDTEGDVDTEAVASASDDAADSEDPAATGDSASGDDSTSTATDDESDSTDTAQSSDPSEDGDQTPSDATDEAAETEDAADTDATDPDTEDVTPAERTELFNWTGDLGALKLSSTGLTIALPETDEPENTASDAEDATGGQADATDDAEESATTDDAEGTEGASASTPEDEQPAAEEPKTETIVPETYPAKLNLTFFLDPANADQVDTAPESIVPGDSFEVALPAGIALANPAATIDVFQAAADGTATTVKIAEATYVDGVLTVTFIAPVDTATGEARELSTYNASIDLDVLLSTSLAGETATQIEWLLQQDAAGAVRTAMLQIPARSAFEVVVELPELSNNEAIAEQEIASTDAAMNVMNALTLPGMMNAANVEGSTTYSYENLTGSAQMAITWCDNNSSNRPAMADYAKKVIPQFSLDGGASWISLVDENGNLTEEARQKLHIGEGQTPNWVKGTSAAAQSIGTWNVSVQGMPTKFVETITTPQLDEDGNQMFDEHGNALFNPPERHEVPISWRLNDTNERPQNYTYGENDGGSTGLEGSQEGAATPQRYLMSTQDYTFTIQGKLGDKTLKEIFGDNLGTDAYAEYFRFSALIDNKQVVDGTGNVRSGTLEEMIEAQLREGQAFDITFSEDGNTATIKATLPQYDLNGAPIVYYAYFEDPTDTTSGKDYYQPAYNNSASPSHGSSVYKLYDGGTMTIRPMGTMSYDATKVWLDGENSDERPAASFTLWRYSKNGSPATASQVQMNAIDGSGTAAESVEYVTIEIPAGSQDDTIDLGKLLAEQYGEQGASILSNLPKYDPDGYPYIYALREDTGLSSNYEVVFGSVDSQGNETDTQPNYTDGDGVQQKLDQPDRANDPFIYNDGTITNRLTGTVTVDATKTWEIAAFQDSLDTVTVTFTAQSRLASSTSDADWQDTDTTIKVDGWKAETLSQTFSGTFDQYDSQGRELEYRWIETGISIDGEPVEFERDGAGGGSFTLTLENMEGEPEDLAFTSTFEEATDPDGTDTITNTFDNTTYERVDKFWEQPDGTMAQIPPREAEAYGKDPADLDTDGIATVQLFQDGKLIGAFEMDGTVDPSATEIRNLPGATYQETSSYHLDFEDLPKYNPENGVRYTYLVLETPKAGWYVDRIYDAETHTTTINNAVGEGEGSEIRVIKQWNDGDDSSHRLPVVVDLVAVKSMTAEQNIDPATGELYHYDPGDIVVEDIVLTAGESWYAEVNVPIGNVDYTYFKVVERGMGVVEQEDGSIEPQYPAVTYEEAEDAYEGITDDLAWINTAWEYMSTKDAVRIATPDHVYRTTASEDAEPTYLEDMQAVTASNRRLGIFDLTIEKTWNDQGEHDRPQAELVVSCLENDEAFGVDGRGGITVSAGGANANTLPVVDNEGNQLLTGGDSIYRVEDGKLIIMVDTADDAYSSTYYIHGLPKYDGNGLVVHYDVEERGLNGSKYVPTKTVGDYNVGTRHFHDNQAIEFTNTRQGTRTVTFHKLWQDRYVNDNLRQRPDIYLTLYRVTVGVDEAGNLTYSEPEQVAGYVQYLWSGTPDTEDPQYQQSCSIANLPAYDKNGSEYIYYASESMSADGSALDYTDVQFSYEGMASLHEDDGEQDAVRVPGADQESNDPTENGTGWAIHENGTFVNSLTDNLVARGTKLWEDVPANVSQGATGTMLVDTDLPEITVYLQQRVQGEDWSSLQFKVNDDGTWSFVDGSEAIAWTSDLEQVTTNQYSYSMAHTGENTTESVAAAIDEENPTLPAGKELLPRYTEDGRIYEYRAIEVVWGLVGQPGGVTSEWIEETDFSELRDSADDSIGVYVIKHGETGSFLINNVYTSETGSLTVQKHYTGRDAGDLYPETTFDVYRYYVNADGEKSDAALVDSVTLTNDMLKAEDPTTLEGLTVENAGKAETTAQYTFSGLEIFAPDGSYWQYYVVEHNINGYKTTVAVGDVAANNVQSEGEAVGGGVSSGALCPVGASGSVEGTVLGDNAEPDVTFKNEYTPEPVDLTGTKTWVDFNNIFNIRPTAEEFMKGLKVERIDNSGAVDLADQLQSTDPDDPYYFRVTENADTNTYTITLSGVDKWSPDGTAYRYRITETLTDMVLGDTGRNASGYYTTDNTQDPMTATSTVNAQSPGSGFRFTNTLEGQATVEKQWNDGDDPYGLRPTTVTVRLQARYTYADGETSTWQDPEQILNDLGYWDAFVGQFESEAAAKAFLEKTLSADTGWRGSWTGLPMGGRGTATGHTGEFFSIEYRAVEVAIGDQKIEQPTSADVTFTYTKADGTAYHPYQPAQDSWTNTANSSATTISNTLETTKISATKTWAGDDANAWGTRGGNEWTVHYLLQRRLEGSGDEGWQWLMEYGAEQAELDEPFAEGIVSETISGTDDSAVANWENLPDCDENGTPYEYRVV
uniref:Cna B-type domain-containing protein n=1 Tax=Enorma sp. TaxID=1920692 RepID=UPI003AB19171